ncbi:hypothetical protein BPUTEOSOX_643 [thiotrophic endosymbiont of Bathymodiolus puteoserpentis (Logatchev)]|nr:hypothetical protein BPUTEOSOX_643 [thiotrophic endosymbiont of Bathymodiolus puteoserpentis (Logatchev)]
MALEASTSVKRFSLEVGAFTVKEKLALSSLSYVAFFAVTVYTLRVLTSVGVPLMVQVVLSILKPAGNVGATVQLAIAPPELLKVMSVMAEPIIATWSATFAILGAGVFTVKDKLALPVLPLASFAVTVYTLRALTSVGVPLMVQVALSILKPAGSAGVTVQLAIAPPELLKVMSVMTESIITIWSAPVAFARLGAGVVPPAVALPHATIDPSVLIATKAS